MPDFAVRTAFTATDKISPAFKKMGRGADVFGSKGSRAMMKIRGATSGLMTSMKGLLPLFGVGAIVAGFNKLVGSARMIEDAAAAFTPLLGGVEKATQLVKKLNVAAAETPFQFETLSNSAKQLLPVMKGDIEKTINTIKMLGDTAGGNAEKMKSITRGFTKAMLKGKVDMESLNMIAEAGVPIFTELATSMGFGEDQMTQFFKKISTGKVSTDELEKVFKKMTAKGGKYFEGMIIASKTTSGVISTMKDNVTLLAAELGTQLLPYVKQFALAIIGAAKSGVAWIKSNKEIIGVFVNVFIKLVKLLPYVVVGFLAYKAALISVSIWQGAVAAVGFVKYFTMMIPLMQASIKAQGLYNFLLKGTAFWTAAAAVKLKLFTLAQWLLNAAMSANPIGLVIIAIAAFIAFVILAIKYWDKWGAAFMTILGPIGYVISFLKTLYDRWRMIKEAFTTGGIIAGLKAIGKVILDSWLYPIQKVLELIAKIPGIGKLAGGAAAKIKGFREGTLNAPNQSQVQSQKVRVEGQVNFANAPKGTTANFKNRGAAPIKTNLQGPNNK